MLEAATYINTQAYAPEYTNANFTDNEMQSANGAYVAMAALNWSAMWLKYAAYVYWVVGW